MKPDTPRSSDPGPVRPAAHRRRGPSVRLLTIAGLLLGLVGVGAMLAREVERGATFRAADAASYQECIASIPAEWRPGSLERDRAETSCAYNHGMVAR
jgi:hypothetical protein